MFLKNSVEEVVVNTDHVDAFLIEPYNENGGFVVRAIMQGGKRFTMSGYGTRQEAETYLRQLYSKLAPVGVGNVKTHVCACAMPEPAGAGQGKKRKMRE